MAFLDFSDSTCSDRRWDVGGESHWSLGRGVEWTRGPDGHSLRAGSR